VTSCWPSAVVLTNFAVQERRLKNLGLLVSASAAHCYVWHTAKCHGLHAHAGLNVDYVATMQDKETGETTWDGFFDSGIA
jgi:hypothetical protein